MNRSISQAAVIGLLQRVLLGDGVTEQEVMDLVGADLNPRAAQAWHLLAHFVADEDIRARDPEYARVQLDGLSQELAALDAG